MRFAPATNCPSRSASSATTSTEVPTGPIEPGSAPNASRNLLFRGRPERGAERLEHLALVEPVVPAHEPEHDLAVGDDGHRLRRRGLVDSEELGDVLDRRHARRLDLVGRVERLRELGRPRDPARDLEIGRVVAALAGDERVLARSGRREVVHARLPPIIPDSASTA